MLGWLTSLAFKERLHLFEFHDLEWFPHEFRVYLVDLLHITWVRGEVEYFPSWLNRLFKIVEPYGAAYRSTIPVLVEALERTNSTVIADLCSGGGGPILHISRLIKQQNPSARFILTDLYPNIEAFESMHKRSNGLVTYAKNSVDATDCSIVGFRTLFNSFHHFAPPMATLILKDSVDKKQGIAVFESVYPRWWYVLLCPFLCILFAFIITPFIRPFGWKRLFWTYVIPVVPAVLAFDGFVSCLRGYSSPELRALTKQADPNDTFRWNISTSWGVNYFQPVTWCVGIPK